MDMMMGFLMLTTHIDGGRDHDDQDAKVMGQFDTADNLTPRTI